MKHKFYIGAYTEPIKFGTGDILQSKGEGIISALFDDSTGEIQILNINKNIENPSFLTLDSTGKYLYTVNELKKWKNKESGTVSAFKVDKNTGELVFLNRRLTHGKDPCHIVIDKKEQNVYVSNFMNGSICVIPIDKDGSLKAEYESIQHQGSSINKQRQAGPHAHACVFDKEEKIAIIPDLGLDKLMVYKMDKENGKLAELVIGLDVIKGGGPRSGCFNKKGDKCYFIMELASMIVVYNYDKERCEFSEIQCVKTIPNDFKMDNICAHIQLSKDEKYLYASNRGHDSIVTYKVDKDDGKLSYFESVSCFGKTPRHFSIDPTGKYILVANQDSDGVVVMKIDENTGKMKKVNILEVGTPVCIRFEP